MTATTPPAAATISEFYRLVDANEIAQLAALFAEDARYIRPGYPDLTSSAEIENFYRHDRVIASGRHQLDSVAADGKLIAVRGDFSGHLRDGSPVSHRFAEFFQIASDGKIVERETFFAVRHV